MGGAGIGGSHAYESAILNPASLIDVKKSYFALQTHSAGMEAPAKLRHYSVFMTDAGEDTNYPGTLFYRQRTVDIRGQKTREQQFQLSGAAALTKSFAVGISGYKIRTDLMTGSDYSQYNADLGAYWLASEALSMGAVFRGVAGSKNTTWLESRVLPMAGLGAEWRFFEMFRFRYDVNYFLEQNSQQRFRHQIGGEVRYDFMLVLRTGYSQDDRLGENRWTAGIGWEGPKLKVGYAYQKENRKNLGDMHSIDMWFDF